MLDSVRRWLAPPIAPEKAATGPFVYNIGAYPPLHSIANNPVSVIAEAQALFYRNAWIKRAEQTIVGRYVKAAWHLEDGQGNTVDEKSNGPERVALDLLTNPNPQQSRRALWSLTMRHQGLAGNGFWFLDGRQVGGGPPTQCLYINPARMTPVDTDNGTLLGWVMDHPQNPVSARRNLNTPVPFEVEEIRHFVLDEPDWGHYGVGIAEAAYDQVILEEVATKHATRLLSSGGRLAGMISPKAGVTIGEEAWASLVRDWRNIAEDPEAAKRLQIVKGPVDFTPTAADPAALELHSILTLGRDDIFAAWGIPLSQGPGIKGPAGLSSGESQAFEEAALWQGPIDLRAGAFEEQVQAVLDMFQLGLRLVVESPSFDDQAPLFENASKATKQPLTNNERRAQLGLDPLEDDELGKAIFMEGTMVRIDVEPEPTPPALLPFTGGTPPPSEEDVVPEDSGTGEAPTAVKASIRENTARLWEPRLRSALQGFLDKQAAAIANRVKNNHGHLVNKPLDTSPWWNERQWNRELTALLEPLLTAMADSVGRRVRPTVAPAKAGWIDTVLEYVRRSVGLRITGINQTTRDTVARLVAAGVEQGLSPADLAQTIREGSAFDEARADMIARTETATAYNEAALATYRNFEVREVQAIDGDTDEECAARNGNVYSVDEAFAITDHPNGTLDWIPVISTAKADPELRASMGLPQITIPLSVNMPEVNVPATVVNVEKPDPVVVNVPQTVVNVPEAPQVVVPAPIVNMPEAKAGPQTVIVAAMPDRIHHVVRRKDGTVEGSTEVDA